jgi:hypothetical protein
MNTSFLPIPKLVFKIILVFTLFLLSESTVAQTANSSSANQQNTLPDSAFPLTIRGVVTDKLSE